MIPAGSQVVLTVSKPLEVQENSVANHSQDDKGFRKSGSVGVVMECPPHNGLPYLIQFTDGSMVKATFDELALRRQEINALLSDEEYDYTQHVIYRCQVGSKAFGLSSDESDDDLRGIFLPPAERHWSLFQVPEQIELQDESDEVYWELEKFVHLALKANPNILETLWTPLVLDCDPVAAQLRNSFSIFVETHLQNVFRIRVESVSPHEKLLRENRQVQNQARHASDSLDLLRNRGSCFGRDHDRCLGSSRFTNGHSCRRIFL